MRNARATFVMQTVFTGHLTRFAKAKLQWINGRRSQSSPVSADAWNRTISVSRVGSPFSFTIRHSFEDLSKDRNGFH